MGNPVDWVILAIAAWHIAVGIRRGFIGSAVDLSAFLLSISIALAWSGRVFNWAEAQFGIDTSYGEPLAFVSIWIVAKLLLDLAGGLATGPFQWLLRGSSINRLFSVVPSAAKGFAIAGFGLMLLLTPPAPVEGLLPETLADVRESIRQSRLASTTVEAASLYERLVGPLVALPQALVFPDGSRLPEPGPAGNGTGADTVPSPRRTDIPSRTPPDGSAPPVTGQGFPREVNDALDLLDRSGNSWVRDTVNRWVTGIRFVPGRGGSAYIPGTGYFGQMIPRLFSDGTYYSEIIFAESQRRRGKFLAGFLAHEAAHVRQSNTDLAAYQNCLVREPQAYLLQGKALLDLFGQDLEAIRRAPGVNGDEIKYATAARNNDFDAMVRYARPIYGASCESDRR